MKNKAAFYSCFGRLNRFSHFQNAQNVKVFNAEKSKKKGHFQGIYIYSVVILKSVSEIVELVRPHGISDLC